MSTFMKYATLIILLLVVAGIIVSLRGGIPRGRSSGNNLNFCGYRFLLKGVANDAPNRNPCV